MSTVQSKPRISSTHLANAAVNLPVPLVGPWKSGRGATSHWTGPEEFHDARKPPKALAMWEPSGRAAKAVTTKRGIRLRKNCKGRKRVTSKPVKE